MKCGSSVASEEARVYNRSAAHTMFKTLFVAQSDHGVDAGGAARGNEAGENGHAGQDERHGGECYRIARADSVEQMRKTGEQAGENQRGGCSDGNAGDGEAKTVSDDHTENISFFSAERHANADLMN